MIKAKVQIFGLKACANPIPAAVNYQNLHYFGLKKVIWIETLFFSTKIMLLWTKNSSFCEKLSKFCINRANKNKAQMWFWRLASNHVWGCSRGNVWLIWLKFSDNVGMILVFIWYSHQKILRPPSSPQTAHLKCLKTYWLPCIFENRFLTSRPDLSRQDQSWTGG